MDKFLSKPNQHQLKAMVSIPIFMAVKPIFIGDVIFRKANFGVLSCGNNVAEPKILSSDSFKASTNENRESVILLLLDGETKIKVFSFMWLF